MKFEKEFKDAISELPSSEKDKLILRLLRRDRILAERLLFELLGTQSLEERRTAMEATVKERVRQMSDNYRNAGYLATQLRSLSGTITEHVKITKDKFGEVSLNLLMLNETIRRNGRNIEKAWPAKAQKLSIYIIARTFRLLILLKGLHEDYFVDLKEDFRELGQLIGQNDRLKQTAAANRLDTGWLLEGEVPENIAEIHKQLKANGFLR